ncbi:hypothetical protein CYLTODRAFT_346790 [Cylindrobasidium torrendii FP15055 ss-10]|uniref:Uncharacterized protein n=1 Tax=Cylindrobasidium torrendii FP15055 ss-10 TaxID=1314674 RepID=A0A0D7BN15_9AGAR|nr:hypothetical protein CYLTODRAFT_346790 [Cylindrobasidium torrendii FP15055 ss-10]
MTTVASAFSQTLGYITTLKLHEVERQRAACTTYVKDTLSAASATPDPCTRLDVLIQCIENWDGLGDLLSSSISLWHYKQWLFQARNDPSISSVQVEAWCVELEKSLNQAVRRYDYAKLFGDLLTEWLKSGDSLTVGGSGAGTDAKKELDATALQQDRIQELIFKPKETDAAAITAYLDDLFSSPDASTELAKLRQRIEDASRTLLRERLTTTSTRNLIQSLLARDLLSAEKAATLKSFLDNSVILDEVTSVLNMQLASIDQWDWPEDGVRIEMRRHLSGKYRAYMDNELMEALLFQYVGVKWSIAFKHNFRRFAHSPAWKVDRQELTRAQAVRRKDYLFEQLVTGKAAPEATSARGRGRGSSPASTSSRSVGCLPGSIQMKRENIRVEQFFMTQLPDTMESETPYDEEPKANEQPNRGMNAQQVLLRLVSTEAHLLKALHGQCTIMRADLEWFGPSLPHSSILAVLEFFGMPTKWLTFMRKWLNAKLRFDDGGVKTRQCGVPIAHALSVLCGEAVLFGMDYAVNQKAGGTYIYRIYDDFWFYTHDSARCAVAWKEMQHYAKLVGIAFNTKKTGAVCVGAPLAPTLPTGVVGWGFLKFDADKGRFVVDQAAVDVHIAELKRQLDSTKSIFGFVNALNKYLEFFRRNFAQPARTFGMEHVEEVIHTFGRIHRAVFSDTQGSVVLKIQQMIAERFGSIDVPAGWCFLPVSQGGLQVVNPIISLLTVRADLESVNPAGEFAMMMDQDQDMYAVAKNNWLNNSTAKGETFDISFEEYSLGREICFARWGQAWETMQSVASTKRVPRPSYDDDDWAEDGSEEMWIGGLYEKEIQDWFGNYEIVEPTLIPVGLLSTFRSAKVAWDS